MKLFIDIVNSALVACDAQTGVCQSLPLWSDVAQRLLALMGMGAA